MCGLVYCAVKAALLAATQLGADVGEWEYRTVGPLYLAAAASMLAGVAVPATAARGGPVWWARGSAPTGGCGHSGRRSTAPIRPSP